MQFYDRVNCSQFSSIMQTINGFDLDKILSGLQPESKWLLNNIEVKSIFGVSFVV